MKYNIKTITPEEVEKRQAQGFRSCVFLTFPNKEGQHWGDIISFHKTYKAADDQAARQARWSVKDLADLAD